MEAGMSTTQYCPQLSARPCASCSCCCSGAIGGGDCSYPPASSSTSPCCPCACGCYCCCCSTCCCGSHTGGNAEVQQVNAVFTAADAALQALWRSSVASMRVSVESGGSEEAYNQVKTAARSQAAASIAWILAAASVVLKEDDVEVEDDNDNMRHPRRRSNVEQRNVRNLRRDLSRSNGHYNNHSNHINYGDGFNNRHRSRPASRWEWRPVITSSSASPSSSPHRRHMTISSSSHDINYAAPINSMAITPLDSPTRISISSLLPSLISCRIADSPYHKETLETELDIIKTNYKDEGSLNEEQSPNQNKIITANYKLESHTKAWMTPPEEITIDIIDNHEITQTLVQPFNINDEETILCVCPPPPSKQDDKTDESPRDCEANSSTCTLNVESKLPEIDELSSTQAGKNHKKHLKKKQRKASANQW